MAFSSGHGNQRDNYYRVFDGMNEFDGVIHILFLLSPGRSAALDTIFCDNNLETGSCLFYIFFHSSVSVFVF